MEPNVYTGAQRDARLRPARESYPLEKAVFVPRELVNKHGCGTLNISHNDVLQIHNYYDSVYGKRKREFFCSRPPGNQPCYYHYSYTVRRPLQTLCSLVTQ